MNFDLRFRSSFALMVALAFAACVHIDSGTASAPDASDDPDPIARKVRPPPPPPDAGTKPPDAGGYGGDPASPGIVSCASGWSPSEACAAPSHCCFSNYSAQHDGECATTSCTWGTIACDGPEDCATGQHCCAHVMIDAEWGILGYQLACQASACGAAPVNQELCHPTASLTGTCPSGSACVPASSYDYDIPPALYVCK